jgi:hypothetical protein
MGEAAPENLVHFFVVTQQGRILRGISSPTEPNLLTTAILLNGVRSGLIS